HAANAPRTSAVLRRRRRRLWRPARRPCSTSLLALCLQRLRMPWRSRTLRAVEDGSLGGTPMNLNYGKLDADPAGNASTLAVFLHGFRRTNADINDPIDAARAALAGGVDVYAPTLPYRRWFDWTGANRIVARLVADLDDIWSNKKHGYQR